MADVEGDLWVILGDVGEMVGDGAANVGFGVVLEQLEQRQGEMWVGLELREPRGPRQPGASAFADQTADVRVFIGSPAAEKLEAARAVLDEEGPNAEFGGEALGDFVIRGHAALEMRDAIGGDQMGVWKIEEGGQSVTFSRREGRAQGPDEKRRELIEARGQLLCHGVRDVDFWS